MIKLDGDIGIVNSIKDGNTLNRTLTLIRNEVELEGYVPGTPEYDRIFLERRVQKCQEMQNVKGCPSCKAFWDCSLVRQYTMDKKFGGQK